MALNGHVSRRPQPRWRARCHLCHGLDLQRDRQEWRHRCGRWARLQRPLRLSQRRDERKSQKNKLCSYCIASVRLPDKRKGSAWRRPRKTPWQTRPTRGCRCPAKRRIAELAGEQGDLQRGFKKKWKPQSLLAGVRVLESGWGGGDRSLFT